MIGVFPQLYPDELLYSAIARFAARMRIRGGSTLVRILFGDSTAHLGVTVPAYLDAFLAGFPHVRDLSVEGLIANHTMLPLYAPFLPPGRVAELRALMRANDARMIRRKIGVFEPPLALERLRLCKECVDQDRNDYGECFWRRSHQIPALPVCTIHEQRLYDSDVPATFVGRRAIAAEDSVQPKRTKSVGRSNSGDGILLELTRSAVYLLGLPCVGTDPARLANAYRDLLFERGLLAYPSALRATALKERMWECFPEGLLEELGAKVADRTTAWPLRMLRPEPPRHPIYHLVFLATLQYPVEELLPGTVEARTKRDTGEQLTISAPRARVKFERTFRRLRRSPNVSIDDASQQLGLSRNQVAAIVRRMNLERTTKTPSYTWITMKSDGGSERRPVSRAKAQETYRERWKETLREHPRATRQELARLEPSARTWLMRHDRDWYESVSPDARRYRPGTPPRHDWSALDGQLAEAAVQAREELLRQEPPVRISKAALLRRIGLPGWRSGYDLLQMPRLNAVLDELCEPLEQYYPRRLRWAASEIESTGLPVTRTRLRHRVPMVTSWWHAPGVETVINEVCRP
jgi:hypothetical protein